MSICSSVRVCLSSTFFLENVNGIRLLLFLTSDYNPGSPLWFELPSLVRTPLLVQNHNILNDGYVKCERSELIFLEKAKSLFLDKTFFTGLIE